MAPYKLADTAVLDIEWNSEVRQCQMIPLKSWEQGGREAQIDLQGVPVDSDDPMLLSGSSPLYNANKAKWPGIG